MIDRDYMRAMAVDEDSWIRCDYIKKGEPVHDGKWYWYTEHNPRLVDRLWVGFEMLKVLRWASRGLWP